MNKNTATRVDIEVASIDEMMILVGSIDHAAANRPIAVVGMS